MNLFNHLAGFPRSVPGLERKILRALPQAAILGTLALLAPSLMARLGSLETAEALKAVTSADILSASLVILHWTVVFTVALASFIVMVMKGPGYVADAYPLADADDPDPDRPR